MKPHHDHLRYAFLGESFALPVIISSAREKLLDVVRNHKLEIGWTIADIGGINRSFCAYKIFFEEGSKLVVDFQRHSKPNMKEIVKKEIIKWLDTDIIYPISDSLLVSPLQCI